MGGREWKAHGAEPLGRDRRVCGPVVLLLQETPGRGISWVLFDDVPYSCLDVCSHITGGSWRSCLVQVSCASPQWDFVTFPLQEPCAGSRGGISSGVQGHQSGLSSLCSCLQPSVNIITGGGHSFLPVPPDWGWLGVSKKETSPSQCDQLTSSSPTNS